MLLFSIRSVNYGIVIAMKATVITLFPEVFPGVLGVSLIGRALKDNLWSLDIVNLHDFGYGAHKKVDDKIYGGGHGLLLRADVLSKAIDSIIEKNNHKKLQIIYMSPKGKRLEQSDLLKVVALEDLHIVILCGRFKGVDQRVLDFYEITEISVGDYILSGGEVAAMLFLEGVVRLLPGVIKSYESVFSDSFFVGDDGVDGVLECAHYTRPVSWRGIDVPGILLSGDHGKIADWRLQNSADVTKVQKKGFVKD